MEVNEVKLARAAGSSEVRLATPEEVKRAGLISGSASPVGLSGVKVIADESIELGSNFVVGANKDEFHLLNANYPRDFKADIVTDIALAKEDSECSECASGTIMERRGIEVGHVFKLGTGYSETMGAFYASEDGEQIPVTMGCYGIGLGRLLAAAIEQHHDENGIIFPATIAPFHVYIAALNTNRTEVVEAAENIETDLLAAGVEVLYDDRAETAGVKLNDSALVGLPVRVVVSPRNLKEGVVEIKARDEDESVLVPMTEAVGRIKNMLSERGV